MDDITNEWLSTVLGRTVTGYATAFLEGGVLSDAFKLYAITYDGEGDDAPSSVVVKLASRVQDLRGFAMMGNAYNKELNFFQYLAKDVPINSPKVYGCFSDGSEGSEYFIIVMEDLTAHSKVFDQVDDPPNEAFARKIALEAAKLHAKFWESETTRLPWVGRDDNRYVFALDSLSKMGHTTWAPFRTLWAQMYGRDIFDHEAFKPVEELTELLCGPQGVAIHEQDLRHSVVATQDAAPWRYARRQRLPHVTRPSARAWNTLPSPSSTGSSSTPAHLAPNLRRRGSIPSSRRCGARTRTC